MSELVDEVAERIAALPKPQNGQVRAVPDDRTIRYYGTIGLLDRPAAMRGRTALYGRRHAAQVVAIKRLQTSGKSLAEIQALWPTLDDATLSRMSGIELPGATPAKARAAKTEFWKKAPAPVVESPAPPAGPRITAQLGAQLGAASGGGPYRVPHVMPQLVPHAPLAELRVELAPNISLSIALSDDVAISRADVAAIRAAAAPLIAELARRQLAVHADEGDDV